MQVKWRVLYHSTDSNLGNNNSCCINQQVCFWKMQELTTMHQTTLYWRDDHPRLNRLGFENKARTLIIITKMQQPYYYFWKEIKVVLSLLLYDGVPQLKPYYYYCWKEIKVVLSLLLYDRVPQLKPAGNDVQPRTIRLQLQKLTMWVLVHTLMWTRYQTHQQRGGRGCVARERSVDMQNLW